VVALLGPTNTGKTYLAVERMLAHRSGMIGFPLRLLARENYDRVVRLQGEEAVALVTGEERIVPRKARYFLCTVEAMPLDRPVEFLAVDEVQLCADRERGHVFTDRLLHARGVHETMLLGADTIRPLLKRLVPSAEIIGRPRLSTLRYAEPKKLEKLDKRSAVIAFSVASVYEIAERLRVRTGGAALVFGALSPRTRNAQVGLYESGEVEYLVATDAIGMGLNLQIEHVVFTGLVKFDGLGPRSLSPAEVAQIAGRAGRHTNDGTFGSTATLGPLPPPLVAAVEGHRFEPLRRIHWRNPVLRFDSPQALLRSLELRPPDPCLLRMRHADDQRALRALAGDPEVMRLCRAPDGVRLLWEVCQVPDFRNVMDEGHARLLGQIYRHLSAPGRHLPEDWVAAQVAALDRSDGDVEALLFRIAGIRTWTYVSHRPAWLPDAAHWQERTRAVEDRLSDALHERLTQQFVDQRVAVLVRQGADSLPAEVTEAGEVLIQGLLAGRLEGFRFTPDREVRAESRGLLAAANRALREGIRDRVLRLQEEDDAALALSVSGHIAWRGAPVGRLVAGEQALSPGVEVLPSDLLDAPMRETVRRRLTEWLSDHLSATLEPLARVRDAPVSPAARGFVFSLVEGLGSVPRRRVARQLAALDPADRRRLSRLGVTLGRRAAFLRPLLRPEKTRLRSVLAAVHQRRRDLPLPEGRPSWPCDDGVPVSYLHATGYLKVGPRAIRMDRLEHLLAVLRRAERQGADQRRSELLAIVGCRPTELDAVLEGLDYHRTVDGRLERRPRSGRRR
jgi:ATP-dependent RNA helicase SUPV3L1/SUV3